MISKCKLNIRQGVLEDLPEIGRLFSNSVRELCKMDYDADVISHWIASRPPESRANHIDNKSMWVAESDGKIVGYLVSIPGEIIAIFVHPLYVKQGVGTVLGKLGIEIAKNGKRVVKLESTLTAQEFYKKLGFETEGYGYYSHGSEKVKIPVVNMVLVSGEVRAHRCENIE